MGMDIRKEAYSAFELTQIRADEPAEVPETAAGFVRVEIPSAPCNSVIMKEKGFSFGDRTLGVAISLRRMEMDLNRMIRFEVRKAQKEDMEAVLQIALSSFPADRRFHIRPEPDQRVADVVIREWVKNLTNVYVCLHKETVVGFLDLESVGEQDCFIHLAAVTERYRSAGAALSLYASAIKIAQEMGKARVLGRISSMNTAVMNLYARLGGVFSDPVDVFLKDE